jgi:hypothetical protein
MLQPLERSDQTQAEARGEIAAIPITDNLRKVPGE